jgi:exopolyphosphatase/guanosine-5'-triphosphate,3'-diphosphate pyrophosphatase
MFTSPPTRADVLAALDIGTNNCRLLIARCVEGPEGLRPEIVDAFSRLVRLGEGLSQTPKLSDIAMNRTVEALSICYAKMQRRGVTRYRVVATESCRRATNAPIFLEKVRKATGLVVEVISASEEARLALQGCLPLFEPQYDYAIHFDIGGGSAEIAWAKTGSGPATIEAQTSLPLGVSAMTEVYGGDRVSETTYQTMVREVKNALRPFAEAIAPDVAANAGRIQFVGCPGTVSTIAALVQNLTTYRRELVDGYHLDVSLALETFKKLRALDFKERAAIPSLGQDRADLIIAGCAIVEAIATTWNAPIIRVADRGVREGILYDLIGAARRNNP